MTRRRRAERGASMVEFVLILPLVALLAFGAIDGGTWYLAASRNEQAAAAGARAGANLGDDPLTDHAILAAVSSALAGRGMDELTAVIVYRTDATGAMHPDCATRSVFGECNHYVAADLTRAPAAFSGSACDGSTIDAFWCPERRDRSVTTGPDHLGIRVVTVTPSLSGVLPVGPVTIGRDVVIRIEPETD